MAPTEAEKYTYRVVWSEEDQGFVGLCAEFPSLSWLDPAQAEALRGVVALVREVLEDMRQQGEPAPEPLNAKKYSGRISLRTTPQVHQHLALAAAEAGVSINRYINSLVAQG